jgi:carbon monoxide dehydrogenase subunit G
MARLEHSVFIDASIDQVEAVLYDGSRLAEWVGGVQQAQPDSVFPQPGGTVQLVYSVAGLSFPVTLSSVEVNPGHSATTRFEGAINGSNVWTFQPEDGGTRVTCVFEYDLPGGQIGQAVDRMVFEKQNAANLERGLNALKALVEG